MNDILFGNNNKAVIKKLANRSFHSNKMRNVIVAIAIALTTFLFTAVLTIGMGASGTLEYSMAKLMGSSADALVQGLSEKQFQQLKENAMFEKVGCWIPVEIMTNTNRRVAEVDYADQNQLEIRMLTPRTGSAPQKANEVLVSANILKDLNIEEKIGAEIPVELKVRQSDQVYHFDMVVSGIYDTPNEKSESVIVSKAFLEENAEMMSDIAQGRVGCGIYTADVVMRDNYMVKDRISELVRNIGGNPDDASADNAVRVAPNPIVSNESGLMMWLVAGVFGVLFMFCGYLLIYNVFEIAVTNDIRQYGLLRTVGTTSRQIRRLVNRQALYLFLIGTPFGLLFGTLLGRSILPAALQIFAVDYSGGNIEVGTLPYCHIMTPLRFIVDWNSLLPIHPPVISGIIVCGLDLKDRCGAIRQFHKVVHISQHPRILWVLEHLFDLVDPISGFPLEYLCYQRLQQMPHFHGNPVALIIFH